MAKSQNAPDSLPKEKHYHGHRERLRMRFSKMPKSLSSAELLELLLGYAIPRGDTKPLAKEILAQSKNSLYSFLSNPEKVKIKGGSLSTYQITLFKLVKEMMQCTLHEQLKEESVIDSPAAMAAYVRSLYVGESNEKIVVIFLDCQHHIIAMQEYQSGVVNAAQLSCRAVAIDALKHNAVALIIVHNHPAGTLRPSYEDIQVTRKLQQSLDLVQVRLLDHLIVARNELYSMKTEGEI